MHQRLLSLSAHRLRTVVKHLIYAVGCVFIKPILLIRRRFAGQVDPSRILYVGLAERGDFILVLPTLIEIKQHFPNAHITCWVRGFNRPLAGMSSAVDQIFVYDEFRSSGLGVIVELLRIRRHRPLLRDLRNRNFTLMIDDSGSGFTTLIGALAGIKIRIGRNSQGYGFLNHYDFAPDSDCQLIQKRLKLLWPLGIVARNQNSVLNTIAVDDALANDCLGLYGLAPGEYFTVQPNGGWRAKNWPQAHFATVVAELSRQSGLLPVLLGADQDRADLEVISSSSGVPCLSLAGKLELDELAAVIADSAIHIGVDSVGSHLACALGTKSLTIFGPTNPLISHSFSEKNIAIFKRTRCTPRPVKQYCCFDAGRTCPFQARMGELRADEVLNLALDLLHARNRHTLYEL